MFTNIIQKIKNIASIMFILGAFLAGIIVITAFVIDTLLLILVGIVIFFSFWVSAIFIYGFGEIIDKLDTLSRCDYIRQNKSE